MIEEIKWMQKHIFGKEWDPSKIKTDFTGESSQ
jgi:hypothetical protein